MEAPLSTVIPQHGSALSARRRRRRQLFLLQTSAFGTPGDEVLNGEPPGNAVLRASSLLDEDGLRASWRLGRHRLLTMAEFERHHLNPLTAS